MRADGNNMFDLEKSVAQWRRQMKAGGVKDPDVLDELESHLREKAGQGASQPDAFELAVKMVGPAEILAVEFKKLERTFMKRSIMVLPGIVAISAGAAFILPPGKSLLWAHILTVTLGYGAAFLGGGVGVWYVSYRLFDKLTPARRVTLTRMGRLFGGIAAGMIIAGFVLGLFWAKGHWGNFGLDRPRGVGGLCATMWLIAAWVATTGRVSERTAMLVPIAGNIVVSVAWFAALGIQAGRDVTGFSLLWVFVAINLAALVIGLAPGTKPGEACPS